MDSLKVNPCCIEVLEQVLAILKKHVTNVETESEFPNDFKNESQLRTVAAQLGSIPVNSRTINNIHHHTDFITSTNNIHHHTKTQILQSNRSKENHSENQNQLRLISRPIINKNPFVIKPTTQPSTVTSSSNHNTIQSKNQRLTVPFQIFSKIPSHQIAKKSVSAGTGLGLGAGAGAVKVPEVTPSSQKTYAREQPLPFQDSLHLKTVLNNELEVPPVSPDYSPTSQVSTPVSPPTLTPLTPRTTEQGNSKEVELISGLGVNISEEELNRIQFNATTANDPAILVIALLQHFFSDEVLARSTATSCRGKGRAKHSTSQPLNQQIMEAIRRFSVLYSRKINRSLTETQVNRITANKIGTAKMALKRRREENSLISRGPRFGKMLRSSVSLSPDEFILPTDEDLNFVIKVEKDNEF